MGELFFVAFEDLGGLVHAAGAFGEGSFALGVEGGDRQLELLLYLGAGKRLKGLESFSSSRINGGNGHDESSLGIWCKKLLESRSPYCLPGPLAKGSAAVIPLYHRSNAYFPGC